MHEIYDYVTSKPELDENLLMHYGIKGMKWKKRLKGAYYSAKSKLQEKLIQKQRKQIGIDPKHNNFVTINSKGLITGGYFGGSGKANSHSGRQGSRLNAGLAAGRYRAAQKKSVKRFYNTNTGPFPKDWNDLRFKGYSNSMTNAGEKGLKVKSGIAAGRKRAAKKKKK